MTRLLLAVCAALALFSGWQAYQLSRLRADAAQAFSNTMERMNEADDLDPDDRDAVLERLRRLAE